jgi:hypothetical protein
MIDKGLQASLDRLPYLRSSRNAIRGSTASRPRGTNRKRASDRGPELYLRNYPTRLLLVEWLIPKHGEKVDTTTTTGRAMRMDWLADDPGPTRLSRLCSRYVSRSPLWRFTPTTSMDRCWYVGTPRRDKLGTVIGRHVWGAFRLGPKTLPATVSHPSPDDRATLQQRSTRQAKNIEQ